MLSADRIPAEAFPLGVFLQEEMTARGWDEADVAVRMGGDDVVKNLFLVQLTLAVHNPNLILDEKTACGFARAFDVSPAMFLNLDSAYRAWCAEHPDSVAT